MRKFTTIMLIVTLLMTIGCHCHQTSTPYYSESPPYEYIQSPTGQQMVVVHDNSGAEFLMEYMLFTSLMNNGGYGAVINNYHTYPTRYNVYNRSNYSNWHSFNGQRYNSNKYSGYSRSNGWKNTSPSNSTSSSWRNTSPTTNKGWKNTTPSNNYKPNTWNKTTPSYTKPNTSSSWSSNKSSSSSSWKNSGSSGGGWKSSGSSSRSSGWKKN